MSFLADNQTYEAWLHGKCTVVEADLALKHRKMNSGAFSFLRATFFRWARTIEGLLPDLAAAPAVLAVGDMHIENFGTWRDAEDRLVWGVNDFDEAAVTPYPFDLVRLAASVRLSGQWESGGADAAAAILAGYRDGLAAPRPTLLDERALWMRPLVACSDKDREKFWKDIDQALAVPPAADPPAVVQTCLQQSFSAGARIDGFAAVAKGAGSLGRPRFMAVADWRGGRVVREAKAVIPSAWEWTHGRGDAASRCLELATSAYRAPDPFLEAQDGFLIRRVAADARKIEMGSDPGAKLERGVLEAMGFDVGAVHAAEASRTAEILKDLAARDEDWLHAAGKTAAAAVTQDWKEWKAARP